MYSQPNFFITPCEEAFQYFSEPFRKPPSSTLLGFRAGKEAKVRMRNQAPWSRYSFDCNRHWFEFVTDLLQVSHFAKVIETLLDEEALCKEFKL